MTNHDGHLPQLYHHLSEPQNINGRKNSSRPSWHYPRVPDTSANFPSLQTRRWTIPRVHTCSQPNSTPERSPSRALSPPVAPFPPLSFHISTTTLTFLSVSRRDRSQPVSLNAGSSNSCALVSYCTCQEGCQGRFVVSVDDDPSHPYNVPGQRIGVVVVHPIPPD
jgi:hypothetical protein